MLCRSVSPVRGVADDLVLDKGSSGSPDVGVAVELGAEVARFAEKLPGVGSSAANDLGVEV